jgi:two-component sensor histidine kinase
VRLAPRADPAAFAQAVEGRIAALAGAQVVLSEASWRGADLRTLAEGAVRAFRGEGAPGAGPPPVEIAGPPVFLAATAAQPVSLALHELATNAAKYGALSAAGGRVRLSWSLAPDGALALRWEESGGPELSGAPARRGFGSRVLEATMAEQLGGSVQRHWPRSGLVCEITLPARSVIEAARPAAPVPAEAAPA